MSLVGGMTQVKRPFPEAQEGFLRVETMYLKSPQVDYWPTFYIYICLSTDTRLSGSSKPQYSFRPGGRRVGEKEAPNPAPNSLQCKWGLGWGPALESENSFQDSWSIVAASVVESAWALESTGHRFYPGCVTLFHSAEPSARVALKAVAGEFPQGSAPNCAKMGFQRKKH